VRRTFAGGLAVAALVAGAPARGESPSIVGLHSATGVARLVTIPAPSQVPVVKAAPDQATAFLDEHGAMFGIRDPRSQLEIASIRTDRLGWRHVSYQQRVGDLPVFGAILRVHVDEISRVRAANGVFLPDLVLDPTTARVQSGEAVDVARRAVAKTFAVAPADLDASARLTGYHTGLVRGVVGTVELAWEVEVAVGEVVLERVFVGAADGALLDRFREVYHLDRSVAVHNPATVVWREGDELPYAGSGTSTDADVNTVVPAMEDTWQLFANLSGGTWLAHSGDDAPMLSVVASQLLECPNAVATGSITHHCLGVASDDVVAHEWTHNYTSATHGLIYAWQPGALNESYSDIFGEVVDLLNDLGGGQLDDPRPVGSCASPGGSVRWLVSEDARGFNGAIRDMWRPSCYGDPATTDDLFYWCATLDDGGVHTNSGIPNHVFAIVVDGGRFNDREIRAIGLTKAAHIWWRAMSVYQVPTTDFADHADLVELSCADLVGAPLTDLVDGRVSNEVVTRSDCAQIAAAMDAAGMHTPPAHCTFRPLLAPDPPLLEGDALLDERFAAPPVDWVVSNRGVYSEYSPRDWTWTATTPDGGDGDGAMFAIDSRFIGDCQPGSDDQSGVMYLHSPVVRVAHGSRPPVVAVDHWVSTEAEWDGANLKLQVDGGPWRLVPADAFLYNAYNGVLKRRADGNPNPIAGEPAFTGSDGGTVEGSWGQSQVDLRGLVRPGQWFRLRFDLGVDGCNGREGWYLDRVRIVTRPTEPHRAGRRATP
jgi:hypothetical protein